VRTTKSLSANAGDATAAEPSNINAAATLRKERIVMRDIVE
jgi:hypothetical protein